MPVDFSNERYVRIYVRDTVTVKLLSWQARAVLWELLRKADRSGVIDVAGHGPRGVAALVGIPADVVTPALVELVDCGTLLAQSGRYVLPRFLDGQEAASSDKQRARAARERRRDGVTPRHDKPQTVTETPPDITHRDETITVGHSASLYAELRHSDLSEPKNPDCANAPSPVPLKLEPQGKPTPKPKATPTDPHNRVIAAYSQRFEKAHGSKPTIDGKVGKLVKSLLGTHEADEIIRRLDVLASGSGPPFLYRDGTPWHFGTLASNFDALVKPSTVGAQRAVRVPYPETYIDEGKLYRSKDQAFLGVCDADGNITETAEAYVERTAPPGWNERHG